MLIALTVASSVSAAALDLAVPSFFQAAQAGKYISVVRQLGFLFIGLMAVRLLEHYMNLYGIHVVNVIRRDIKRDLFSTVIHRQMPDYIDHNVGEYIAEFTNDITIIESKFLIPVRELVSYIITIVTVGAAIITIDYRMVLVIIVGVVVCLAVPIMLTKYTSGRMIRFLARFDRFVQRLKDVFGAFFTFKNYSVEGKIIERFADENTEVEKMKYDAEFALVLVNNFVSRLAWFVEIMVLVIGLLGVVHGTLSIGSVFAAHLLASSLGGPLQSLGSRISMVRSVKSVEKKFRALGIEHINNQADGFVTTDSPNFDVKFENVSLAIKDKPILKNISLHFEYGKKYLILGNNGSGKSTIAKLLKKTFRSYTGNIKIGDYDFQSPQGRQLARSISYSNEIVSLITDSVRNNILLYRVVPEGRLESAIALAGLNVDLDRIVGDSGRFLSSGERRKLEIARALIDNPKVIIFDEVVSTLDIETAYEIEKQVLAFKDRTVIMISNAFSGELLEKYDQVILMENGSVVATGTHRELLEKSEQYRTIYRIRCTSC